MPFLSMEVKQTSKPKPETVSFRNLSNDSLINLSKALNGTDFDYLNELNANECYKEFHSKFSELFNLFCPFREYKFDPLKTRLDPWMTKGLLVSRATKIELHKNYVKLKNETNREIFKTYCKLYNLSLIHI